MTVVGLAASKLSNKKRNAKLAAAFPNGVRCQKCLEFGHWSYECKEKQKYVHRSSRTKLLNKKVQKKITEQQRIANFQAVADVLLKKRQKRNNSTSDSSNGSSSSDSESDSSSDDTGSSYSGSSSDLSSSDSDSDSSSDSTSSSSSSSTSSSSGDEAPPKNKKLKMQSRDSSDYSESEQEI